MLDAVIMNQVRFARLTHDASKTESLENQRHRAFQLLWPHLQMRRRFDGKKQEQISLNELADEARRTMIDLKARGDLGSQDIATLRRKIERLQRGHMKVMGVDAGDFIIDERRKDEPRPRR